MTDNAPVLLRGKQVMLREFRQDDLSDITRILGDDRVTTSLSFDSKTQAESAAFLNGVLGRVSSVPRGEYYLAITNQTGGAAIGFARLGLNGVRAAKLGYAVDADHWGKGFATDATQTLVDFGFRELSLHRISAAIGPKNTASIAVAKHLGMSYEGCIRDHVFTNGSWRDSNLYSILSHEWRSGPSSKRTI